MWFKKKEIKQREKSKRVLDLEKFVGQEIEVHHLDSDTPKIERNYLRSEPTDEFFYLGTTYDYHVIFWDKFESMAGNENIKKRNAVKLIKTLDGVEIYRNDNVPFDYNHKMVLRNI